MEVFVTGSTYGYLNFEKLSPKYWQRSMTLTRDDILIVCGDFSLALDGTWIDKALQDWYNKRAYTVCFISGDKENHFELKRFPEIDFYGGKAHKISDNIYHLLNGECYNFGGKKFFCFGGSQGFNEFNIDGLPKESDYIRGKNSIIKNDFKFDYILTHCASTNVQAKLPCNWYYNDFTDWMEINLRKNCSFDTWFFSHYDTDRTVEMKNDERKYHCVYQDIVRVL
jgi:hypothetical protein